VLARGLTLRSPAPLFVTHPGTSIPRESKCSRIFRVFDSISEEKLKESAKHVPATGFPWQDGANVYIAGHRLGYPNTDSLYVFYDLDKLVPGDEISLKDSDDDEYFYKVTRQTVIPPDDVDVMNADKGKSIVTLQTCTLPDYAERLVVQGELVEKPT
jgi:sortase A